MKRNVSSSMLVDVTRRRSRRARLAVWLALAAAAGTACVPRSTDFRLSKVGRDEAAIAGRIAIIYNGALYTENCQVTFGGNKLKLSADGIVLLQVQKGWMALERLDCKDTSNQHVRIRGAHLYARGDGWISDFGDVAIIWATPGGFKASSLFGLIGGIIDEASDDGVASVEVKPPVAEVRQAFQRQTGVEGRWAVAQLSQPRNAIEHADPDEPSATAGPRGFFCARAVERSSLSVCEREQAACERTRSVLNASGLAPCAPAETAWCFVAKGVLRCAATEASCKARPDRAEPSSTLCGEQY
jgi:hypothetical protein